MTFGYQLIAALSIGMVIGYLVYIATGMFLRRRETFKDTTDKKVTKKMTVKEMIDLLKENPKSKEAKRLKLTAALIVFLFVQALFWKIIFAFMAGAGVFIALGTYGKILKKRDLDAFDNQLLDGLGIITSSVRSGQSIGQAIENMIKETKPPFSNEFTSAMQSVRLGIPIEQALFEITKRVESNDLRIMVTSINLAKETGGNMAEILTRLAETMRERKKIHGKVKALTAQGKASGYIVGAAPFLMIVLLSIIEPSIFGLIFTTTIGNLLLLLVVFNVSLGMFFINKIVDINI